MCLEVRANAEIPVGEVKAWKVMSRPFPFVRRSWVFPTLFFGRFWRKAQGKEGSKSIQYGLRPGETYPVGFHAYASKDAAWGVMTPVTLKEVHTIGYDFGHNLIYVARKMRIGH